MRTVKRIQSGSTATRSKAINLADYLDTGKRNLQILSSYNGCCASFFSAKKNILIKPNSLFNGLHCCGLKKGGSIIDVAGENDYRTIEFCLSLRRTFYFHQHKNLRFPQKKILMETVDKIFCVLAGKYLRAVEYKPSNKNYFSGSFFNDAGGCKMRNAVCKNSSAPKAVTRIQNGAKRSPHLKAFLTFFPLFFCYKITMLKKGIFVS
jgi:hypothetical protein